MADIGGGASRTTEPATGTSSGTDVSLREHIMGLFHERDRALEMAGVEREKAAAALRAGTDQRIAVLETLMRTLIEAKSDEFRAIHEASQDAIAKAESAAAARFEAVNEFRAQLGDQANTFLPRETFDSVIAGWTQWREQVETRLNQQQGATQSTERHENRTQPWTLWVAGAGMTIVLSLIVVLVNVLTSAH